jgi:hypothetical protein
VQSQTPPQPQAQPQSDPQSQIPPDSETNSLPQTDGL